MSRLWLTPVHINDNEQTVTFLTDRLVLQPANAAECFLDIAKAIHPRMLLAFKSNLLLSEESELACGVDELPFVLDGDGIIIFGQGSLELSHCAQAYLDRLPSSREMGEWLLRAAAKANGEPQGDPIRLWFEKMLEWHKQGYAVILLKEDHEQ
jgi:hypothetical protein